MDVELVSGNYFSVLGVKPILGHGFTEAEDEPAGGHPVAMVSYSWWKRRLGRDPAIVGKAVTLESTVYTIIGVTPPEFFGATVGQSSATTRSGFPGKRAFAWAPSFDKNRQTGGEAHNDKPTARSHLTLSKLVLRRGQQLVEGDPSVA